MRPAILLALLLAGCGGHGETPPAVDSGPQPDTGAPCPGGTVPMFGELIDFDSSSTSFLGVNEAAVTLPAAAIAFKTPPNGRLDTCVPKFDPNVLAIDAPDDYFDSPLLVQSAALSGLPLSIRALTATRAPAFYSERGLTFDPAKAHVLVFLAGDRAEIALDRAHGAVQAGNDDSDPGTVTWSAGSSGRYVLFPNVDVTSDTATIEGFQPLALPIAANQITLAAIAFFFI